MSSIIFRGLLEGGSELLDAGRCRGEVRHCLRIYQDTRSNVVVAAGKIWGDELVLQHAVLGKNLMLRLRDGGTVRIIIQRRSLDEKYVSIGVDGPVPGF